MNTRRYTKPIATYYARGFSMRETAIKFALSHERVRQLLRRDYPELIRVPNAGMRLLPQMRLKLQKIASNT
jgi:predicted DNA-binding protein YlxM (UPF0122 family)